MFKRRDFSTQFEDYYHCSKNHLWTRPHGAPKGTCPECEPVTWENKCHDCGKEANLSMPNGAAYCKECLHKNGWGDWWDLTWVQRIKKHHPQFYDDVLASTYGENP